MKYCTNCGAQNEENTNFCSKCGSNMNANNFVPAAQVSGQTYYVKEKNGKSIASLVLGIISVAVGFIMLLGMSGAEEIIIEEAIESNVDPTELKNATSVTVSIIPFVCGLLGLIFGIASKKKNGKAIAGIITSSLGLIAAIICFVYILGLDI